MPSLPPSLPPLSENEQIDGKWKRSSGHVHSREVGTSLASVQRPHPAVRLLPRREIGSTTISPKLGLTLCCYPLEILHTFQTGAPRFHVALGCTLRSERLHGGGKDANYYVPGRGHKMCKGSEVRESLEHSRTCSTLVLLECRGHRNARDCGRGQAVKGQVGVPC